MSLRFSAWPRFGEIVHGDERLVEDILRSVFKQTPLQDEMTGAKLIVLGSATLGVLLNDPPNDLDSIRPHLAEWWRRNLEDFRKQGIIGAQRPTGLGVGGDRVHGRSVNDPLNGGGEGPWVKRASE